MNSSPITSDPKVQEGSITILPIFLKNALGSYIHSGGIFRNHRTQMEYDEITLSGL